MATQFDATARINVDLQGFRQAANQVTRSGGDMERVFRNLHNVMGRVELVERNLATELQRSLRVYNQISQAARNYATAVTALSRNESAVAQGARTMSTAFDQLRRSLASVQGLSEREFQRLQRTLTLYNQMAQALNTLARAQQAMVSISRGTQQAEAAAARERTRAAEAARRLAIEEQRLQIARQASATAARNAASQELRAQTQLLRVQNQLAEARRREAAAQQRQAAAQQRATAGVQSYGDSLFGLRSALGDLQTIYQGSINLLNQIGTAAIGAAISHESAFAQIERVTQLTGSELTEMQHQFEALAATLPTSFEETALVAQLASQTGVANEQLIAFTDTVIRFSVTTGVASEQATLLFARIMEMRDIPAGDLDNFASTILDLGVTSAATEDEILRLSESIATVTDIFGLTVPATLGLASAFANLRVRPELARGALTRVFAQLNTAIRDGGTAGETLQQVLGATQEEMASLLDTNPDAFFLRFVQGMSSTVEQGGLLRQILADLGINAVRDIDVISRLANNYDLLAAQVSRARVEFLLGNTLQEQSATIFETTRVEIDNMREAFTNFLARAAGPVALALGEIASVLNMVLQFINSLGPVIPILGGVAAAIGVAVGAFIAYRIAVAAAWRGVLAYIQAQGMARGTSFTLIGALQQLAVSQQNVARSATQTAVATTSAATSQTAAARAATAANASNAAVAASSTQVAAAMRNTAINATQLSGAYRTTAAATSVSNAAMANQAALARNGSISMMTLANAQSFLGRSAQSSVGPVTAAMRASTLNAQAAQASAQATTAAASATAASATTMTVAGRAATVLAGSLTFLRANWLSLLGVAGLLAFAVSGLVMAFRNQRDAMRAASQEAVSAVGGIAAYQEALIDDTLAAREASGGIEAVSQALRDNGVAATEAGLVYRTVAVAQDELAGSLQERTQRELEMIETQRRAIELAWGSAEAIAEQAAGQGAMAEAAREAQANLEALTDQEEAYRDALDGTTLAFGERSAALVQQQFQEALVASELLDTAESYERLQAALSATDFNIGDIITGDSGDSLRQIRDTIEALEELQSIASSSNRQSRLETSGLVEEFERLGLTVEEITELGGPTQLLDSFRFLESVIQDNQAAFDEAQRSASILTELGLDPLGDAAREDAEAAEAAADAVEQYQTRLDGLAESYSQVIDPAQAWRGETDEAIRSVEAFTQRLQEQIDAQQGFAQNLAVLAAQGYGALVTQLQAMGPEGAQAAAELVNATEEELQRLDLIAFQAGDEYVNALAGSMDRLGQLDLGGRAATNISNGILEVLNRVASDGGDLQLATQRIISVLDLLDQQSITPEVTISIFEAMGNLETLEAAIAAAQADGSLDAEGEAALNTFLYDQALTQLLAQIETLEQNNGVDAEGNAELNTQAYREALNDLIESTSFSILEGLLDAEGNADLSTQEYEDALDRIEQLREQAENSGSLDPDGTARLDDRPWNDGVGGLQDAVALRNRRGDFDPRGRARLDSSDFRNRQIPSVIQAAWSAGAEISRAMTRTVTVSVLYSNLNSPPPSSIQAATGGWIHGPGGPTDDRIPAQLSDGEFVVNAASAKKYGALLEAINSQKDVANAIASLRTTSPRMATARASLSATTVPVGATRQAGAFDRVETGPTFTIYNNYPQAEPTSVTVNRSLAYAATISGV